MTAPFAKSAACRRLAVWRRTEGHTAELLARVCGVAESTARKWLTGHGRPAEHLRGAVFVLTGILPRAWRTAGERKEHRAALRRAQDAAGGQAPAPRQATSTAAPASSAAPAPAAATGAGLVGGVVAGLVGGVVAGTIVHSMFLPRATESAARET